MTPDTWWASSTMLGSNCSSATMSVRRSKARRAIAPSGEAGSPMARMTASWRAHSRRSVSTSPADTALRPSAAATTAGEQR